MFNLASTFDDSNRALSNHAANLTVASLPAAVFMMQMDVLNHYGLALDHYFTLTLKEEFLQNSSRGTPYQKWASVNNANFGMLSFAIHNLLRYTSRLLHESEILTLRASRKFEDAAVKSNFYTNAIGDIRFRRNSIGITIHEDQTLSISSLRLNSKFDQLGCRSSQNTPTEYFRRVVIDGKDVEEHIDADEFQRLTGAISIEKVEISDRTKLNVIKRDGKAEICELEERNRRFGELCDLFYQTRNVAERFKKFNESWWI